MKKSERNVNGRDKAESNSDESGMHPEATALITTEITGISLKHGRNHTINEDIGLFY